jgi:hypothetical protein
MRTLKQTCERKPYKPDAGVDFRRGPNDDEEQDVENEGDQWSEGQSLAEVLTNRRKAHAGLTARGQILTDTTKH